MTRQHDLSSTLSLTYHNNATSERRPDGTPVRCGPIGPLYVPMWEAQTERCALIPLTHGLFFHSVFFHVVRRMN